MPFDWKAIVTRNRADLVRLVALLFSMVGTAEASPRLSREVWLGLLRMLRPAEAAMRRLIVIAARGLTVKVTARARPKAGIAPGAGARRGAFALFDPRRPVGLAPRAAGAGPRIRSFDEPALAPQVAAVDVDAGALLRRLHRLRHALDNLPAQARRLARWRARHPAALKRPMRPGRPPGFRDRAGDDFAQDVLRETQMMALWAMAPETV